MKRLTWMIVPAITVSLAIAGCSKKEEAEPPQIQKAVEAAKPAAPAAEKAAAAAPAEAATTAATAQQAVTDQYSKLLGAFDSADADTKSAVAKAVEAAKAGNTADALKQLQAVLAKGNLTADQQQSLKDLIAQLEKQIAAKAVADPAGAASDLKKSLPFGK